MDTEENADKESSTTAWGENGGRLHEKWKEIMREFRGLIDKLKNTREERDLWKGRFEEIADARAEQILCMDIQRQPYKTAYTHHSKAL